MYVVDDVFRLTKIMFIVHTFMQMCYICMIKAYVVFTTVSYQIYLFIMSTLFIHQNETDSTNRYLADTYRTAAPDMPIRTAEMVIVQADYQTAGRGQGTHTWESARGENLLCSMLVHPQGVKTVDQYILSKAGALALYDLLNAYVGNCKIKWPNDIYYKDRKLAGTLIETTLKGDEVDTCIFGIGLNINQTVFPEHLPNPISLYNIVGQEVDIMGVMKHITIALVDRLKQVYEGQCDKIHADYDAALYRHEGMFRYRDSKGEFTASIKEVADDGHLLLEDADGQIRSYTVGEVEYL